MSCAMQFRLKFLIVFRLLTRLVCVSAESTLLDTLHTQRGQKDERIGFKFWHHVTQAGLDSRG